MCEIYSGVLLRKQSTFKSAAAGVFAFGLGLFPSVAPALAAGDAAVATSATQEALAPQNADKISSAKADIDNPVILYFHGLGGNSAEPYCLPGGKRGLVFTAFKANSTNVDFKGFDYDHNKVVNGDYNDLKNAVESYVRGENVNTKRVILVGTSMGGYTALGLYTKLSPDIKKLISGAIVLICPENLETLLKKSKSPDVLNALKPYGETLKNFTLAKLMDKAEPPAVPEVVVFVRLHDDLVVPAATNSRLVPILKSHGAMVREIGIEGKHGVPAQLNYEIAYQHYKQLVRQKDGTLAK